MKTTDLTLDLQAYVDGELDASRRAEVERVLGYPCFVKPSGSGSSVGVHKVKHPHELDAAIRDALRFDPHPEGLLRGVAGPKL